MLGKKLKDNSVYMESLDRFNSLNIRFKAHKKNMEYSNKEFKHKHDNLNDMNGYGYYVDLGYDVSPLVGFENWSLIPWMRQGKYTLDDFSNTNTIDIWKIGMTCKPIDKIVFKTEYGVDAKNETKTKEFNLGMGYMF